MEGSKANSDVFNKVDAQVAGLEKDLADTKQNFGDSSKSSEGDSKGSGPSQASSEGDNKGSDSSQASSDSNNQNSIASNDDKGSSDGKSSDSEGGHHQVPEIDGALSLQVLAMVAGLGLFLRRKS